MEKGDLVKIRQSGKMGVYLFKIDSDRCKVQMVKSLLSHLFLIKDLERINEDR